MILIWDSVKLRSQWEPWMTTSRTLNKTWPRPSKMLRPIWSAALSMATEMFILRASLAHPNLKWVRTERCTQEKWKLVTKLSATMVSANKFSAKMVFAKRCWETRPLVSLSRIDVARAIIITIETMRIKKKRNIIITIPHSLPLKTKSDDWYLRTFRKF